MIPNQSLQLPIATLLIVSASWAWSQVPSPVMGQYSGCLFLGFEARAFVPEEAPESVWWFQGNVDGERLDWNRNARRTPRGKGVFVVVRGSVSPEGHYGHLDSYTRQITVSSLVSARRPLPQDRCGRPASVPPRNAEADSMYRQGVSMERDGHARDAMRTYRRAARAGSGEAAKRLGDIFRSGIPGIPRDHAESIQWYDLAEKLGVYLDDDPSPR